MYRNTVNFFLHVAEPESMESHLPDDALSMVLYYAYAPVPWPWAAEAGAVCRRWHALCVQNRRRGWYLAHSTLGDGAGHARSRSASCTSSTVASTPPSGSSTPKTTTGSSMSSVRSNMASAPSRAG